MPQSSTRVDHAMQKLRSFIEQGVLTEGDRLPSEPQLVERLQVSRPVLREAISRLETLGLLSVKRGSGTYVGGRSSLAGSAELLRNAVTLAPRDIMRFTEFRHAIETSAARRAAEMLTDADVAELEDILAEMDAEGQQYIESIRLDFKFHSKLVQITGNELMCSSMEAIKEFVMAGMVQTTPAPREKTYSRKIHRELLDAILTRNPDVAGQAATAHAELTRVALAKLEKERLRKENKN